MKGSRKILLPEQFPLVKEHINDFLIVIPPTYPRESPKGLLDGPILTKKYDALLT
jgi:hypothetical protein